MVFTVNKRYSRADVKEAAGLTRDAKGGPWDTGIVEHEGEFVIFTNIDSAGRTGHNYGNTWEGARLRWYHKMHSTMRWPSVRSLLSGKQRVHVFWRSENTADFTYAGLAHPVAAKDTIPVEILWSFPQ